MIDMIKINCGTRTYHKTEKKVDVIARSFLPNKIKDVAIGGGLIIAGVFYLTAKAFAHGIECYHLGEIDADFEGGGFEKGR